ncbi:MAG: glycosyl hydrolase family 8 [Deltaproteobacteria bacterium]
MNRRFLGLLLAFIAAALLLTSCKSRLSLPAYWLTYRNAFFAADGRVVDTGNNGISHSEGQGYGMLLAQAADDPKSFDRVWQWTKSTLQVRSDHLFAWQYLPGKGIGDKNNATDGDMLISWALLCAGRKWGNAEYIEESRNILADIRTKLVRIWHGKHVLLPGEKGFAKEGRFTINLSYWIYPALHAFSQIDASPVWGMLIEDGLMLSRQARFGSFQLPPDWLELGDKPRLSDKYPPRFGYDAIRIPLYIYWYGELTPAEAREYVAYADNGTKRKGFLPAYLCLTDDAFADQPASHGIHDVFALLQARADRRNYTPKALSDGTEDYYSATLTLLVRMATLDNT